MDSVCPVCYISAPPLELQRHVNSHFEDEDLQLAKDLELAQKINSRFEDEDLQLAKDLELAQKINSRFEDEDLQLAKDIEFAPQNKVDDGNISCLVSLQTRGHFHRVEGSCGLMGLLCRCLESDSDNRTTVFLSGYVDHFQSIQSVDSGWGCGWRNIQMLASYLLSSRKDAAEVLFGGSGFVPDIPSLQRWLEIAWQKGFDVPGAQHFGNSVYGSKRWIGTTECAALFRSFGLRARVIDFGPEEMESLFLSVPGTGCDSRYVASNSRGKQNAFRVRGPMDKYVFSKKHPTESSLSDKSKSVTNQPGLVGSSQHGWSSYKDNHQILIDYVWNYFSKESVSTSLQHPHVFMTNKSPLYFQHDGHSRTIVGIEVKRQGNGPSRYNLLILDPGHETLVLERSLKANAGWKKLIKRGVHTLKKPQYQLCHIDPGVGSREEMEKLKVIDSVFIKF